MSAQLENGYIRIANEIWDEIIRRDFSKRQKDILHLILRLSYGCNKKVAHIPLLQDFSLCGVTPNHITEELKFLKTCKVIDWDRTDMFFSFNKNYEIWQMSPVKKWDDERFKDLVHMNLTSQNRNFPKQELPEKGSKNFPKKEDGQASNPWESKSEDASKDSIKDIKDNLLLLINKNEIIYENEDKLELILSFVNVMDVEVIEDVINRSKGNHMNYVMKALRNRMKEGNTKKDSIKPGFKSQSEKEAEIQQRLAQERKNAEAMTFKPEFEDVSA